MQIGAITFDKNILGGEAVFTNTKIPIKTLFNALDSGESMSDFLNDFPEVTEAQVVEVLGYARQLTTSADVIRDNATLLKIIGKPFAPTQDILRLENQVAQAINQHRDSIGKSAFTFNADVSTIARVHSADIAQNKVPLGHNGFDARIAEAKQFVPGAGAAEDVGEGFTSADDILQAWLNSPDDKANIEFDLHFAGIGIERVGQGPNYFTLLVLQ
jgi:uncharacterized protein (DUF433 family)